MQNEIVRLYWVGLYLQTVTNEWLFQYSAHNSIFSSYQFEYAAILYAI